ncbi:MAG: hypothetical protein AAFX65_10765 [Cyanobacteria bacterium J06638_7]
MGSDTTRLERFYLLDNSPNSPPTAEDLGSARVQFGQLLKRWRQQNQWSGKTFGHWHQAAPETLTRQVASATWTNFELGRAVAPAPETFLALENANQLLHAQEYGKIQDYKLRKRLDGSKPILGENGKPWDAVDFFACFIGRREFPPHLQPAAFSGEERAAAFRDNLRRIAGRVGVGEVSALLRVLQLCRNAEPGDHAAIEAAVLELAPFPSVATAELAEDALAEWALDLER